MPLAHWISRVSVNTCLNELRAEKRRLEWRLADFDEETSATIEKIARTESDLATRDDTREAKALLDRLLKRLPPDDRLLITLLHLEERSVEEIYALTGWSHASVECAPSGHGRG